MLITMPYLDNYSTELRAQDGERLTPPWEFKQSVTVKVRAELGMKERGRKPDREGRWHPYGGNCRLMYVSRASKPPREHSQIRYVVDQRDKQKQATAKREASPALQRNQKIVSTHAASCTAPNVYKPKKFQALGAESSNAY